MKIDYAPESHGFQNATCILASGGPLHCGSEAVSACVWTRQKYLVAKIQLSYRIQGAHSALGHESESIFTHKRPRNNLLRVWPEETWPTAYFLKDEVREGRIDKNT